MTGSLDHRAQAKPVIIVTARIGALDDAQAPVVAQALAADAYAFHCIGRYCGEVDVDQGPGFGLKLEQWPKYPFGPCFGGSEWHGVAHAFARIGLAQGD